MGQAVPQTAVVTLGYLSGLLTLPLAVSAETFARSTPSTFAQHVLLAQLRGIAAAAGPLTPELPPLSPMRVTPSSPPWLPPVLQAAG